MKTLKGFVLAGTMALLAACASAPSKPKGPDLTGTWSLMTESPMGAQETEMTVKQAGEALSGTITSQMGSIDYAGTFVGGKDVAFGFTVNAQGMSLQIDYKGVVEGDQMKGTAKFGDFGEGNFTAKRKS